MKVVIKKQIHGSFCAAAHQDRYVAKEFGLEFSPFAGLTIEHKTTKGEIDSIDIKEVIWDVDAQRFVCYCASDEEIYDAKLHKRPHRSMDEILKEYTEADWKVIK